MAGRGCYSTTVSIKTSPAGNRNRRTGSTNRGTNFVRKSATTCPNASRRDPPYNRQPRLPLSRVTWAVTGCVAKTEVGPANPGRCGRNRRRRGRHDGILPFRFYHRGSVQGETANFRRPDRPPPSQPSLSEVPLPAPASGVRSTSALVSEPSASMETLDTLYSGIPAWGRTFPE